MCWVPTENNVDRSENHGEVARTLVQDLPSPENRSSVVATFRALCYAVVSWWDAPGERGERGVLTF